VLAEPILHVWLGARFEEAATAMTILLSYWLIASSSSVATPMLVAAGRARLLAIYAVAVAVINLSLTLALTPSLGIEGVTLGTAIPYLLLQPLLIVAIVREFPVTWGDLVRSVWVPAFALAIPLAAGLLVLRSAVDLESLLPLLGVMGGSFLLYVVAYGLFFLNHGERVLLRSFVRREAA